MTTLKDCLPSGIQMPLAVKRGFLALVAFLALYLAWSHLSVALKTGVAQRLPDTPKYKRAEDPFMFWTLVIFFGVSVVLFAALLAMVVVHWNDEKIF